MFRLRQQICRHISWISSLIRYYHNLTWSGNGINAYMSVHRFFRQCYIDITRSYNLVYLWNTFCSVCQCSDCLCSTYFINSCCTCFTGCHQSVSIDTPIRSRRCNHNDFIHSGRTCRNNIHQYRGWISCFAARYIDTYPLKRSYLLSKDCSVRLTVKPAELTLFLMIRLNTL